MTDLTRKHSSLRTAAVVAVAGLTSVIALNVTAVAALLHPLLGVVALLIMGAAALSVTHAVCERLEPGLLHAFRTTSRSIVRYLHDAR
ncbi:hypothetical protein E4P42_19820 [Mycobacterium sp. PS03-16]|uniref:hypothetical protein n=1 Tax=Mycobacterium sp. PS03-16 TaxID=2559611 RepID=UPI001074474E|nr:hypothetical protein [Mycobacterium sp. PS03-16]TFV56314.1 hypothetical protein E4P42_19820 [Mycobacterium sp. PS03-16]